MRSQIASEPRGAEWQEAESPASPGFRGTASSFGMVKCIEQGDSARGRVELSPRERWFVVQSLPHRESGAAIQLRNQHFRVFLPVRSKTWRHARRIETRLVPFFPGYLFIALDLDRDRWRSVNGTFGVQRLVTSGETRPAPVPHGIVEALIAEADERGCMHPNGQLRAGQAVRILAGPFGDRIGELVQLDDAGRVRVLIELLGGRVPIRLSRKLVMAAG